MSSTNSSGKSHENLLSPRPKCRTEPMPVEVGYHFNRATAQTRIKPLESQSRVHTYGTESSLTAVESISSVQTERQLLKNMIVLGLGFVFTFSALAALQSMQSSLFLETLLGLHSLSVFYGLAAFSCLYGPIFVQKLTPNWTVVLAFVLVALYISTFFYPRPYTVIPSAVLLGLSFGPLFCAQTTFLMQLVSRMAYLTNGIRDKVQQRYLRLFYFFYNSSRIWGHLITALLLRYGGDVYVFSTRPQYPRFHATGPHFPMLDLHMSPSLYATVARPSLCTLDHITEDRIFRSPASYVFYVPSNLYLMLISTYLGLAFLGLATVTTLLDKFDLYVSQDPLERPPILLSFRKVILSLIDPQLRLMFPMILFIGYQQGFMIADFTRSYVSCALGLEAIGYTMLCMAAMTTLGSVAAHQFFKHIKRMTIMFATVVCHTGLLMVLWLWTPVRDDVAVFYVIAAGWGLCNAVWETLTTTYLATTFTYDWQAPFAVYFMAQCIGLTTAFTCSPIFVNDIKICLMAGLMILALIPYTILELRLHRQQKLQDRAADL
ncbi:protein unc-93 homolog A [Nephila pilipes]|uniref:Protein unc-93 homolog A n=1 Tax=Nephila pilipes TaxID=299642 RepID=A0A8X6UL51_NEPPI|nr:protein unc-93 homolog A [Nephila pilipes]